MRTRRERSEDHSKRECSKQTRTHQSEIDFDHLLQRLEAPIALLAGLQVEHLLEADQRVVRIIFL